MRFIVDFRLPYLSCLFLTICLFFDDFANFLTILPIVRSGDNNILKIDKKDKAETNKRETTEDKAAKIRPVNKLER